MQNGRVSSQGPVAEVLDHERDIGLKMEADEKDLRDAMEEASTDGEQQERTKSGQLIIAEEVEEGHVGWPACERKHSSNTIVIDWNSLVKLYLNSMAGDRKFSLVAIWLGGVFGMQIMASFRTWWLGHWSSQYELYPSPDDVPVGL
jgi:hypothetical protein